MMNTIANVRVLFLCFLMLLTLTDCHTCQIYKLEGDTLTFTLTDRPLMDDDRFSIKKDNILVVPKRNRKQEGPGIVKNGFLDLQNVNLNYSGTYTVEVFDVKGIQIKSYTVIVCVFEKVPKPRVNITCQQEMIYFRCDVEGGNVTAYSWHKNGSNFEMNALNFSTNVKADKSEYTCTAHNPVHKNTSDPVEAACFKPETISANTLFGYDFWIMVGILAGGGALLLLLIIVLVTVGCRACKHREKEQRDDYVNTPSFPSQQKSKQTTELLSDIYDNDPAQGSAQVQCKTEPSPRNKKRARPPPTTADEEQKQTPPLPQPRKKAQVRNQEGPL